MNIDKRVAHHLATLTSLPAGKAAIILSHCSYMLDKRGYLYDFEQVLLLRVAQQATLARPDETHCPTCHEPLSEFGTCALCRPRYH